MIHHSVFATPLCLDLEFLSLILIITPATVYAVTIVFQLGKCVEIGIPMLLLVIGVSQVSGVLYMLLYT